MELRRRVPPRYRNNEENHEPGVEDRDPYFRAEGVSPVDVPSLWGGLGERGGAGGPRALLPEGSSGGPSWPHKDPWEGALVQPTIAQQARSTIALDPY